MTKWVLAALAAATAAAPAQAVVITLQDQIVNGPDDFTWVYQGTLGPDEGVRSGDRLIIFDFAGYIDGSIFSDIGDVSTSTETLSADTFLPFGESDDPDLVNLVFTYTGDDFRAEGGPFEPFNFEGLGARSIYAQSSIDGFFALATKNNPPDAANTPTIQVGLVQVPMVPEPATWAMMIGGFGLIGAAARRSRTVPVRCA